MGWSGARVGVGMLRGKRVLAFLASKFLGFSASKFLGFKVSWFQSFTDLVDVLVKDNGTILPHFHVMFSGRY